MQRIISSLLALSVFVSSAAIAAVGKPIAQLSAAQIVEKNVTARGGLDAWRKIQTMVWVGHIENTHAPAPNLPFVLEMKRPNKTRFEITALGQKSVRAYDGGKGWKLRPAHGGKPDLQVFTAEELKFAQDGPGIDGPLIDYQAKGVAVTLDGVDRVEGRDAYRLIVKMPSGTSHHVWIDTKSFLDIKSDREARNAPGATGSVSVFYSAYQTIEGLQIPATIETGTENSKSKDKMVIERVSLNPPLDDRIFAKPRVPGQRNVVSIEAEPQPFGRAAVPPAVPGVAQPIRQNPGSMSDAGNTGNLLP